MSRSVLLLEPNYNNNYPPMGLMKIATYYRCRKDEVRFYKGDLKLFAAQLIFEDFQNTMDERNFVDIAVNSYMFKRGSSDLIEYIRTGRLTPLKSIAFFSRSSTEINECSLKDLLDRISPYRKRYKNGDFSRFDIVCVTTLFTFYWEKIIDTILFAKKLCKPTGKILVGGIASSLVPQYITEETGITPHVGLLDKPYTYDNDNEGDVIIDKLPLDYSILEEIDYRYRNENSYFGYMTRGCINHCPFCAVPKLEPTYCDYVGIKEQIEKVTECFGLKRNLLLMDNNVFASKRFNKIINEIKECGFEKGATYISTSDYDIAYRNLTIGFKLGFEQSTIVFNDRAYIRMLIRLYDLISSRLSGEEAGSFYFEREQLGLLFAETATKENIIIFHSTAKHLYDKHFKKRERKRIIDFNQGLDARLASDKKMSKISEIAIFPLRIAFDHWNMRNTYTQAIKNAANHGIRHLSNYLLYNFNDKPDDLYLRMRLNVDLCEELGVTIYSFPMKYHPIIEIKYFRNRDYIGTYWNRKFIRAVQAVLNSTHGKIGRGLQFFEAAFGKNLDEFFKILWMPETLIIQRYKYDIDKRIEYHGNNPSPYDKLDNSIGKIAANWWNKFKALSANQRQIIEPIIARNLFFEENFFTGDKKIDEVLSFYRIKRADD
jgi:hypothetical protein